MIENIFRPIPSSLSSTLNTNWEHELSTFPQLKVAADSLFPQCVTHPIIPTIVRAHRKSSKSGPQSDTELTTDAAKPTTSLNAEATFVAQVGGLTA
jgi:hypothetical protein